MGRLVRFVTWMLVCALGLPATYLFAAVLGGLLPASLNTNADHERMLEKPVYLSTNMLHADIAIPVNSLSLQQFEFLRTVGFPLDNPDLEYLIVGWGSRAFYTSTKEYSDIEFETVWKAATGDVSVMHVSPARDLAGIEDMIALNVSETGFARLVKFMTASFKVSGHGPILVQGASFGFGDVFYESDGHFSLLTPCNVWVSRGLQEAGLASGLWTPTTYSLLLNNYLYN